MSETSSRQTPADPPGRRPGPRGHRGETSDLILSTARQSFAEHGYAGTSLRDIARAAGVDGRLITYYFGSKEGLLAAALEPPAGYLEGIRRSAAVPIAERGEGLVRQLLWAWNNPQMATLLRSTLLIAAHEPVAMEVLRGIFVRGILPAVSDQMDDEQRHLRAGLVATQLVGLALTRFVYAIDQVTAIPEDLLVGTIGATIQSYLQSDLHSATTPAART